MDKFTTVALLNFIATGTRLYSRNKQSPNPMKYKTEKEFRA